MLILNQASIKLSKGFRDGEENIKLEEKNKAEYMATTSCGRVGRGGNAHFHTFRLVFMDRPTDRPTDRWTDGRKKPFIELRVRN